MKRYLGALMLSLACSISLWAQSGTNSPYSQFGLGMLSDQSSGFNRGMDGLSLGFHECNQVNPLNPASYASLDSLSFIFDVGASGQITNFKENGVKKNAKNAAFDYVIAGFRLFKHFGVGFGLLPYTNIGYSYTNTQDVNDANNTVATNSYNGDGGLHQVFLGFGWEPLRGLSVGVNGSYLYGDYTKSVVNSFSDTYVNQLSKEYKADVRSYKLDVGLQYTARLGKVDELTLGLTYGFGHKIGGKPNLSIISVNPQSGVRDTTTFPGKGQSALELEIPTSYGAGLLFNHGNKLKVGVDYTLQKWKDVELPEYSVDNNNSDYALASGQFKDRHKLTVGTDFCPQENGRKFFKRVHYKVGVSYATPYYYINNADGPKEISASVGFGIPIMNAWNNRSTLNISGQWARQEAKGFITDNTFRINVSLTFNERWFAKWKVQ